MLPYNKTLKPFSRQLRSNMTDAEQRLWGKLKGKQLQGVQFYRQKPIAGYIVDFYAAAANLVVEVDGSQHAEAREYDAERDHVLQALGLEVLRFDNRQVLVEIDEVVGIIFGRLESRRANPPGCADPLLQSG